MNRKYAIQGIIGCALFGVGDWLLGYVDPGKVPKEVLELARETGVDFVLPYYPLVHTGNTLPDVYEMLYVLYKEMLKKYEPENIYFLGGSSGANLALGMISYIND